LFLLAAEDDAYVLQMLAASKRPALDRFVAAQTNSEMVRIYRRVRSSDGPWYIVVIGPYSSKAEAMIARDNLPVEQKKAGPWPKSLASVKAEIEAFRDN
jgi:DamX protein